MGDTENCKESEIILLAWYFDAKFNSKNTRASRINKEVPGFKETPASLQTDRDTVHLYPFTICITLWLRSHDHDPPTHQHTYPLVALMVAVKQLLHLSAKKIDKDFRLCQQSIKCCVQK